jgi:hypothetical protein
VKKLIILFILALKNKMKEKTIKINNGKENIFL